MKTSPVGIDLIKQFEGFSAVPYLCPAGVRTIGYGHALHAGEDFIHLEPAHAEQLLRADLRQAEYAVCKLITASLTQNQFDALVSFTFNLGSGALQRSTLRRVINRGEFDSVPKQWMRWVWAGGRKLPGLARRRAAELAIFIE